MKIGGYNYHVSDQGEGDKVAFLVHGMPDDGSCWKYQAPALLKAGYRVEQVAAAQAEYDAAEAVLVDVVARPRDQRTVYARLVGQQLGNLAGLRFDITTQLVGEIEAGERLDRRQHGAPHRLPAPDCRTRV